MSPRSPTAIRTSAEAIIEKLERVDEIGLELEHRAQRIFPQLLHPSRGRLDRELLDVELRRHLAPLERHRHWRAGRGRTLNGATSRRPWPFCTESRYTWTPLFWTW